MDISIINVSYTYMKNTPLERKALEDINLTIPSERITGIIGHTGSGKSTLIQLIGALTFPDKGFIKVGNTEWSTKRSNKGKNKNLYELRKHIGIAFQYPEHQLFEETVEKDIAFGPKNFGFDEQHISQLIKESMEMVQLPYDIFAKRSPFELSGGQMRRTAIAGVLAFKPKVLILDEPTAGLDPNGKKEILQMIKNLHERNKMTTIIVSHSMDEIAAIADQLVVLNKGSVLLQGKPEEIFQNKEVIQEIGLDIPEITKLIITLNQQVHPPIPYHCFSIDELEKHLLERLKKGKSR